MLPSPISVTIGGTTHSLSRINEANFSSTYLAKGAGFEVRLQIRHQYEKSSPGNALQYERHNIDLQYTEFPSDGVSPIRSSQAYMVVRCPRGTDTTKIDDVVGGLTALATSISSDVVSWES